MASQINEIKTRTYASFCSMQKENRNPKLEYCRQRKEPIMTLKYSFLNRFFSRMTNRRLGIGFRSWISYLHKSKAAMMKRQHHRRISMRFIHVSQNRKLHAAFRAWHSRCITMKRNRMIIKKFVHRMKNITSARTLHRWIDFVSERRATRNCIRRVMQHIE